MASNPPQVALCPRCFCPIDLSQSYAVDFCVALQPPFPPSTPTSRAPGQHLVAGSTMHSIPSSVPQQHDVPAPPYEPPTHSQPSGHTQDHEDPGENRRSSASSSSSFDSAFSDFSINTEFAAELQAAEEMHLSQQPFQPSSPPQPPASSPSAESSLTLPTLSSSPPSTESSLAPTELDEPPSTMRRWVVFRGRIPGIYTSS